MKIFLYKIPLSPYIFGLFISYYKIEHKTLEMPHQEYCISAWSPHCAKNEELLETMQRKFTRMFTELKGKDYYERLRHLNLWTLEERRNRQDYQRFSRCTKDLRTWT